MLILPTSSGFREFQETRRLERAGNAILLDDTLPKRIMDQAREDIRTMDETIREYREEGMKSPYKLTGGDYLREARRLADLARDILSGKYDIWDYIPLSKSGKFPRGQTVLLADTECREVQQYDTGAHVSTLQLQLIPCLTDIAGWSRNDYVPHTVALDYNHGAPRKTPPVFDADGVPSKPVLTRAKNLKDGDVMPGSVYVCGKKDMLFLGRLVALDDGLEPTVGYAYIQHTKPIRARLEEAKPKTILDVYAALDDMVRNGVVSVRYTPRKFTALVKSYVDAACPENIEGKVPLILRYGSSGSELLNTVPKGKKILYARLVNA